MQHSQSKIVSLYWEAGLTQNCIGVIFVLIVSAQSDVFSGNTPNEKTYGLEIKPWPRNRSQVLSILENSVWLTEKLRNYSGSKMFHKKIFLSVPVLLYHLQKQLHVKSHHPVLYFCFYYVTTMTVWRIIFFFPASGSIQLYYQKQ